VDTHIDRDVRADALSIYRLAAAVEEWPRILPHYRWVRVLDVMSERTRAVEMAARRDVLGAVGFPLRWTAVQSVDPDEPRIAFEHVAGVTRGMHVTWTFETLPGDGVRVRIRHVFQPHWPVPGIAVRLIVGEYFVNGVARRTLRTIAALAEAIPAAPAH
jgi:ribosome-associated toxin RatA of RatAB toxin-antitoxin module